jgi:hypothetical protein
VSRTGRNAQYAHGELSFSGTTANLVISLFCFQALVELAKKNREMGIALPPPHKGGVIFSIIFQC